MIKNLKIFLLLTFACLSCFLIHDNVHALTYISDNASLSDVYFYNGQTSSNQRYSHNDVPTGSGFGLSSYQNVYEYYPYYGGAGSNIWFNAGIQWTNKNWCNGSDISFSGFLVPTAIENSRAMFSSTNFWNFKLESVNENLSTTCLISPTTVLTEGYNLPVLKFSCSLPKGSTTRSFKFLLSQGQQQFQKNAYWGIQKGTFTYNCELSTSDIINNNNQNTQNIINNQNKNNKETNDNLNKIDDSINKTNDYLKDDTAPDSDISSLGNVQGLLPAGPVDSLLNIPFEFLSILTSSFSDTCVDMSFNFVFNQRFTIPCFDSFYDDVPAALMLFINTIPSAFILIPYLKHLYKKVDRATSLETTDEDEWGVL